jgi:phosphopentomutase
MKNFKRVLLIVLDSVGIGEMPDSASYGDTGANTLGNIAREQKGLNLPNLALLGLGNIMRIEGVPPVSCAHAHYGKMAELSPGKDTTTGHWEIAGIVLQEPFSLFPEGFPSEITDEFIRETGFGILGNKAASGTEIIAELGEEHQKTGKLIVYTSADSVFQIAAHEETVPLSRLYEACVKARNMLDRHRVARVIARPFTGRPGSYKRTYNRMDYSMLPPHDTLLDILLNHSIPVIGIGKIKNIFAERGVSVSIHTEGNTDGIEKTIEALKQYDEGLIFVNLVDFDMLYGHRNDVSGYAKALEEFDSRFPEILCSAGMDTVMIITADHGCDPTLTWSTDHTREYVPLLICHSQIKSGKNLGILSTFADVGQTIANIFRVEPQENGRIITL